MPDRRFRRVLDSTVKTWSKEGVLVEVFLSDDGSRVLLETVFQLPERIILEARMESLEPARDGSLKPVRLDLSELRNIRGGPGYVRQAREALAGWDVPDTLTDALVEAARMTLQIYNLAPEELEESDFSDPRVLRHVDLTYFPELVDGCIPYAQGFEHLFDDETVRVASRKDIYAPQPGQSLRFRRDKTIECRMMPGEHTVHAYLSDDIHELELLMKTSPDGGTLASIGARSIRSPYRGICSTPFPRISKLTGLALDSGFKEKVLDAVGGKAGCIHLVDLILDAVRYYQTLLETAVTAEP